MKLYSLNRPSRSNRYCGPAVLSFLTGQDTTECARWFRTLSNHRGAVKGSSEKNMLMVLDGIDIQTRQVDLFRSSGDRPTLTTWLRDNKEIRTPGRVYLVVAGNHWQLITGRRYACGRIGEMVSIKDKRVKRRARVRQVWELTLPLGKLKIPEPPAPRVINKSMSSTTKAKAKRLQDKHGNSNDLWFEDGCLDSWTRYVACPEWIHEDPEDFHYCYDWEAVVDLMEKYIKEIGTANDMRTHDDPEASLLTQVRH